MAGLAAGALGYEIALTRLLSVLLVTSWVGPVLAATLLGLGLGAAAASARPAWRAPRAIAVSAALAPLLAVAGVPAWVAAAAAGAPLLGLGLPVLAYACIGLALAGTFARHSAAAAPLYRADLAAAGLAALATPLALALLGALQASLAAAVVLAIAAWGLHEGAPSWPARAATLAVAAALVAVLAGPIGLDPAALGPSKPLRSLLERGGTVEATRWDATARTDVVRMPDGARYVFMDGGAGSLVPDPDPNRWWRDVGAFAFAAAGGEGAGATRAYLIGPGGGLDVAQARAHGVGEVVAVEVNGASVDLVRVLGEAAGGVYDPPTTVVIGDGRRELARTAGAFDVITLANVVTQAAELRGAALTENRVYTLEAFESYLARLTDAGHVALTLYDEATLTRAITTALEALVRGGWATDHATGLRHLVAVLDGGATPPVPHLLVRAIPFSRDAAVAAARVAESRGWSLLLVPDLVVPPALARLAAGEWSFADLVAASVDVDLTPTTDERPFFFALERGVPRDARRGLALASVAAVALAATAPLAARATRRARGPGGGARRHLAAALLGAAFLAVELHAFSVVHRAVGQPAWSLAVTLGALLTGASIGAGLSRRAGGVRAGAWSAAGAAALWTLLAPSLASALDPVPPALAAAVLGALLVLVGVPMGVPFPRLLELWRVPSGVAAAFAASGVAAVVAGAAALWISHALGASAVGWAAAAAYVATGTIHPSASRAAAVSGGANRKP